jgi:hypothetical protein
MIERRIAGSAKRIMREYLSWEHPESATSIERRQNDKKGGESAVVRQIRGLAGTIIVPIAALPKQDDLQPSCLPYRKAYSASSPSLPRDSR